MNAVELDRLRASTIVPFTVPKLAWWTVPTTIANYCRLVDNSEHLVIDADEFSKFPIPPCNFPVSVDYKITVVPHNVYATGKLNIIALAIKQYEHSPVRQYVVHRRRRKIVGMCLIISGIIGLVALIDRRYLILLPILAVAVKCILLYLKSEDCVKCMDYLKAYEWAARVATDDKIWEEYNQNITGKIMALGVTFRKYCPYFTWLLSARQRYPVEYERVRRGLAELGIEYDNKEMRGTDQPILGKMNEILNSLCTAIGKDDAPRIADINNKWIQLRNCLPTYERFSCLQQAQRAGT